MSLLIINSYFSFVLTPTYLKESLNSIRYSYGVPQAYTYYALYGISIAARVIVILYKNVNTYKVFLRAAFLQPTLRGYKLNKTFSFL